MGWSADTFKFDEDSSWSKEAELWELISHLMKRFSYRAGRGTKSRHRHETWQHTCEIELLQLVPEQRGVTYPRLIEGSIGEVERDNELARSRLAKLAAQLQPSTNDQIAMFVARFLSAWFFSYVSLFLATYVATFLLDPGPARGDVWGSLLFGGIASVALNLYRFLTPATVGQPEKRFSDWFPRTPLGIALGQTLGLSGALLGGVFLLAAAAFVCVGVIGLLWFGARQL